MKVLITGGAGFIGYHLANELIQSGYEIVLADNFARGVSDRFLKGLQKRGVTLISIDVMNQEELDKLEDDFDYIYHFAAIIGVQNVLSHSYDVLKKNVVMIFNMIDIAKRQKHLKRFVFTSTSEIYAGTLQYFDMEIPTPEMTPLTITALDNPRTSYMLSKIYGEALLNQSGIPFTIVRPHNFYGPRMGMSHVIPELLQKAYKADDNGSLEVFSIRHKRTFCYIEDAVHMIRLLAENKNADGQAYNIGNDSPEIAMGELANMIIKIVGKSLSIEEKPATMGSPVRRCPSMEKTFRCISYKGKIGLEEGLKRTFEWYKDNIFDGSEVCAK